MKKIVKDFLDSIGYIYTEDKEQENNVDKWLSWYKGKTKDHTYYVYDGKAKTKQTLKTLNMPYQVCSDLSDFFFNEKLDITLDDETSQTIIDEVFETNEFLDQCNDLMQKVEAMGTGAIVPFINENKEIELNYLDATNIIILKSKKGKPIDILFFSDGENEATINCHILKDGKYIIYNRVYEKVDKEYKDITNDDVKEVVVNRDKPIFSIITPPLVNNKCLNSPYGISCYANSLDNLISIDRMFDTYDNELWLGRKRVYVRDGATNFNVGTNGEMTPVFDPSDVAYYKLPGKDGDKPLEESSFDLRVEEITNALQGQLNILSSRVGLGKEYYQFKDGQVYVNTGNIMSSNSSTYRKIKKQENIITNAIRNTIKSIMFLLGKNEDVNVSVFYDDSIIEDTKETRLQAMSELNAGIISKAQYCRDVYKLGDEEAKKFAKRMNEEIKEEQSVEIEDDFVE